MNKKRLDNFKKKDTIKKVLFIEAVIGILLLACYLFFLNSLKVIGHFKLGEKYLESGKYEEAILMFDEVISIEPNNIYAYYLKSDAYFMMNQYSQAIDTISEALKHVEDEKSKELCEKAINDMIESGELDETNIIKIEDLSASYVNVDDNEQKVNLSYIIEPSLLYDDVEFLSSSYSGIITLPAIDSNEKQRYPVSEPYTENVVRIFKDDLIGLADFDGHIIQEPKYYAITMYATPNGGWDTSYSWVGLTEDFDYTAEYNKGSGEVFDYDFKNIVYTSDQVMRNTGFGGEFFDTYIMNGISVTIESNNGINYINEVGMNLAANCYECENPIQLWKVINDKMEPIGITAYDKNGKQLYFIEFELDKFSGLTTYSFSSGDEYFDVVENGFMMIHNLNDPEGLYGFANAYTGEIIAEPQYEDVKAFSSGYAAVKLSEGWTFINEKGKIVLDYFFEDVSQVYEGKTYVKENGYWGILNLDASVNNE